MDKTKNDNKSILKKQSDLEDDNLPYTIWVTQKEKEFLEYTRKHNFDYDKFLKKVDCSMLQSKD